MNAQITIDISRWGWNGYQAIGQEQEDRAVDELRRHAAEGPGELADEVDDPQRQEVLGGRQPPDRGRIEPLGRIDRRVDRRGGARDARHRSAVGLLQRPPGPAQLDHRPDAGIRHDLELLDLRPRRMRRPPRRGGPAGWAAGARRGPSRRRARGGTAGAGSRGRCRPGARSGGTGRTWRPPAGGCGRRRPPSARARAGGRAGRAIARATGSGSASTGAGAGSS